MFLRTSCILSLLICVPVSPVMAEPSPTTVLSSRPNSLFFSTSDGRPIVLGGSHLWENMSDQGSAPPLRRLDWSGYLDWLGGHGHNLTRLWAGIHHNYMTSECATPWYMSPVPWPRSGTPGAADGGNRFDLASWNPEWFTRLRERVRSAGERGVYVMVTLFDGWDLENNGRRANQFLFHPFNSRNNVNGIGFSDETSGWRVLRTPAEGGSEAVWERQKAYIHEVMDVLGGLPGVIYEVANEAGGGADAWEERVVKEVQAYGAGLEYQHPIVRSFAWKDGASNGDLYASAAEGVVIAMDQSAPTYQNPPVTSDQVLFTDGDHNCGVCNGMTARDVARTVLSGNQYLMMDAWHSSASCYGARAADDGDYEPVRYTLGVLLRFLNSLDLSAVRPLENAGGETGFVMGDPDSGYVVLAPGGVQRIDLSGTERRYRVYWHDTASRSLEIQTAAPVQGGSAVSLEAPGTGDYIALLELER